jgi:molecular chaperone HtpG
MVDDAGSEGTLRDWVELLYDQALLTEGSPVEDPARFASRMTSLMQQALQPGSPA